jgi:mycofactocin system transcriptional regulator
LIVTQPSPARRRSAAKSAPTSIEGIEKAALELFAERGFEETPVEDIAAAAGISRRTFFRYFASKNDIPFGNFEVMLRELAQWFDAQPDDRPLFDVVAEGALRFNRAGSDGLVAHRERMELILHTPALRANAALRNAEWAAVVARYTARRLDADPDDLGPQVAAHVALGALMAAYEQWLRDDSADLADLFAQAFAMAQQLPELTAPRPRR